MGTLGANLNVPHTGSGNTSRGRQVGYNSNHQMHLHLRSDGRRQGGNCCCAANKWLLHPFSLLPPWNCEISWWQHAVAPLRNCVYVNADTAAQRKVVNSCNTTAPPPCHHMCRCKSPFNWCCQATSYYVSNVSQVLWCHFTSSGVNDLLTIWCKCGLHHYANITSHIWQYYPGTDPI